MCKLGYDIFPYVLEPGNIAIRGSIVDVFPSNLKNPIRVEFFDNEIESIRTFDINTQLSISKEVKITIVPNTEAKKNTNSQVSLLEYLPKNSVIWARDIGN